MALTYNKVLIAGRLVKDPELKSTQAGKNVTSITVAVNRPGESNESDFFTVTAWNKTAEFICSYFAKGSAIFVEGSLRVRSYDAQDGTKRYLTEVLADKVSFVESKASASSGGGVDNHTDIKGINAKPDRREPNLEAIADDEELPF